MSSLSTAQVLEIWERGVRRPPLERALLLASAETGMAARDLADVSIGRRDQILLSLRRALFGRAMPGYIDCPDCRTRLEFTLDTDTFRMDVSDAPIEVGCLRVRRPTTRDVASVMDESDPERAAYRLAQRCSVTADGTAAQLTREEVRDEEAALAAGDSAADIVLDLNCDQCGNTWQSTLDAGGFLWREIESCARQLLADVHILARGYGWSEAEILAMSEERRSGYIEMVLG